MAAYFKVLQRYRSGNLVSAIEPLNALFPGIVYATGDSVPEVSKPKYGPVFVFDTRPNAERFSHSIGSGRSHAEIWEVEAQEDPNIACFRLGIEVMRHQRMTLERREYRRLVNKAYFEDGATLEELRKFGYGGDYIGHFPIYYDLPAGTVLVRSVILVAPLWCRANPGGDLCQHASDNYRFIMEREHGLPE